jgi:glutathione synthase/RimK-type ligase-like ATP-grasp enzyme
MIIGWPALYQHINDKQALARYIQEKQVKFSDGRFDIHPKTYFLKAGAGEAQIAELRHKGHITGPFIFKPANSGQGKGITVVRDISQPLSDALLQQQVNQRLLIVSSGQAIQLT